MPGEPLSAAEPAAAFEGYAGLFGKVPAAGDFVARGLPRPLQARWDDWLTRHLARWEGPWPVGGLRLLVPSGERALVAVVVPSADRVGRRFPLAALAVLPGVPAVAEAEAWAVQASVPLAAAAAGRLDAEGLMAALGAVPLPAGQGSGAVAWAAGADPVPLDPADPGPALAALSSRGSSTP